MLMYFSIFPLMDLEVFDLQYEITMVYTVVYGIDFWVTI